MNLSLIFAKIIAISLRLQYDMLRANILTNFAGFSPRKSLLREIYMLKTKSNEITDTHQAPCEAPETAEALRRSLWQAWLRSLLLFCCASVYVELCLHLCVYRSLDRRAVYLVLFGLLGGTVCALLTTHLPKIARQIVGVLLVAVQVLFAEVQLMYHAIFGNFMPISQVSMGGNVITNFDSQILYSIGKNIVPILLLLVPLIVTILCLALRKLRVLTVRLKWRQALATLGILLTLLLATMGIMYAGRGKSFSVYKTFTNVNTSTDSSYKSVGMLATTVQELRYMVFGSSGSVIITPSPLGTDTRRLYSSNSYNVIESIDFAKLAESADNIMCRTTDEYLAQVVPTRKNNYTGLLQDYNLITICAESFCPWFISEELTPTLYKLSHTGIIFENYYGTFQSVTTNGEYTMCMGLYPDMSRTKTDSSFNVAGTNYLPFCLGNALTEKGYQTWGYHDYIGDFYNRNITHANMGYLQGGGLRAGYKDRLALLRSGDDGGLRGRLPQQQGALPRLLHDLQRPLSVQLGQRHERQEPRRGEGSALFRAGEGVYRLQSGAGKRADLPAAAAGAGGRGR